MGEDEVNPRRPARSFVARTLHIAALTCVAIMMLPACSSGADQEAAQGLASDLATALTTGQLGAVPVQGGDQEDLDTIVAGMDDTPAMVTVDTVDVEGDSATATLAWQWETPSQPWRYTTTAQLQKVDGQWAVQWTPTLVEPSLTGDESLDATTQRPLRGDILGAGDEPLVTLRPVMRLGIDKTRVSAEQAPESARDLAELLDIDTEAYVKAVSQAGPKAFVEALVVRDEDTRGISQSAVEEITGAVGLAGERPLAPTRDFATEILGRVGPATAEIVEKSGGTIRPGDQVGLSGLQARYDETLAGTPGVVVTAGADDQERPLFTTDVVDGRPLRTTLDERLQQEAEDALDGVGPASALVALRPSTGEILAAASGAGSDGYNTSTFGQYPPGSTMKVVTALALMRAGVQPSDRVPCTSTIVVDGKAFTNYDDYPAAGIGDIPLRSAVANSCNTALISQHEKLTGDDLTEAAASMGLGVDHDLGFPAYLGQVPTPASETEKAASLIGQGKVLASPMAMAAVAASVAEGRAVVPQLLPDQEAPVVEPGQPLTEEEADSLRDMMRAAVTEGTGGFLGDVPGAPVGAKTGTAEFGTGDPPDTHAWMIATQGDLAVAVFVEEGKSGSQTAGPILERFLRATQ
jgi:cell division protein FtsI/penicillin-binding protein 2